MAWRYLVLFDGECGLCDRTVKWLLAHDRKGVLTFAPLQGETARAFVPTRNAFDTIVLVERDDHGTHTYDRSRAFFRILRVLGGAWRLVSWLRVFPLFLTDIPYRIIAKNRRRWFGGLEACSLPTPEQRQRFLA